MFLFSVANVWKEMSCFYFSVTEETPTTATERGISLFSLQVTTYLGYRAYSGCSRTARDAQKPCRENLKKKKKEIMSQATSQN